MRPRPFAMGASVFCRPDQIEQILVYMRTNFDLLTNFVGQKVE